MQDLYQQLSNQYMKQYMCMMQIYKFVWQIKFLQKVFDLNAVFENEDIGNYSYDVQGDLLREKCDFKEVTHGAMSAAIRLAFNDAAGIMGMGITRNMACGNCTDMKNPLPSTFDDKQGSEIFNYWMDGSGQDLIKYDSEWRSDNRCLWVAYESSY